MLCLVSAFRYLMQSWNEYSVMLRQCSRCEKVGILNVFKTGINDVSVFPDLAVFLVFLTVQWRFRHSGSSGLARVFDYDSYRRTHACLLCMFVTTPTVPLPKLLIRSLFFGPCHCSCIFVLCLAVRAHVAGDLNKAISFAVGVLLTSFARALLGFIHQSQSYSM